MTKSPARYLAFLLLSLTLIGCASKPAYEPSTNSWANQCYLHFERDVSDTSGESAIDCGFLPRHASKSDRAATKVCAKKAVKSGAPFKFGYASTSFDSFFCDVAIRQSDGQFVSFFVDSYVRIPPDPDGNRPVVSTTRCNKIEFKPGNLSPDSFFDLQDCK